MGEARVSMTRSVWVPNGVSRWASRSVTQRRGTNASVCSECLPGDARQASHRNSQKRNYALPFSLPKVQPPSGRRAACHVLSWSGWRLQTVWRRRLKVLQALHLLGLQPTRVNLSFTVHSGTTRAIGGRMTESFPARSGRGEPTHSCRRPRGAGPGHQSWRRAKPMESPRS
jgi:hypothetical protein